MHSNPERDRTRKVLLHVAKAVPGRDLLSDEEIAGACPAVEAMSKAVITEVLDADGIITPTSAIEGLGMREILKSEPVHLAEFLFDLPADTLSKRAGAGLASYRHMLNAHENACGAHTYLQAKIARELINAVARAACFRARETCTLKEVEITTTPVVCDWRPQGTAADGEDSGYMVEVPIDAIVQDKARSLYGVVTVVVPFEGDDLGAGWVDCLSLTTHDRNGDHRGVANSGRWALGTVFLEQLHQDDSAAQSLQKPILDTALAAARYYHEKRHEQSYMDVRWMLGLNK